MHEHILSILKSVEAIQKGMHDLCCKIVDLCYDAADATTEDLLIDKDKLANVVKH